MNVSEEPQNEPVNMQIFPISTFFYPTGHERYIATITHFLMLVLKAKQVLSVCKVRGVEFTRSRT